MVIGKTIPHITIEPDSPTELTEIKALFASAVSVLYSKTDNTEIVLGRGNYITNQSTGGGAPDPGFFYAGNSAIRLVSTDSDFVAFVAAAKQYGVDAFFGNAGGTVILVPKSISPSDLVMPG